MDTLLSTLSDILLPDLANIVIDYYTIVPTDEDINNKRKLNETIERIKYNMRGYLNLVNRLCEKNKHTARLGTSICHMELGRDYSDVVIPYCSSKQYNMFRRIALKYLTFDDYYLP